MDMKALTIVLIGCLLIVFILIISTLIGRQNISQIVGVGRSQVTTKIDLTDKLNPAILPELLKEILREMTPNQKPKSDEFQQQVVQKLSQRIMDDPEVNYRVDLNKDENLDPVLVVPESIKGEAAVYSVRVPDPQKYPKDPASNSDWGKIVEEGVELCALSVTFNETNKTMVVDAEANEYLYQDSPRNYRSEYVVHNHSWLETYFTYMVFRDILFGPYLWYRPMWYGGWYGPWYGGWHAPVYTRPVTQTVTRYKRAPSTSSSMRTASGRTVRSSKSTSRTRAPSFIRRQSSTRSTSPIRRSTRSSRGFFRGGGTSFGK
jgi:hypothetical protein